MYKSELVIDKVCIRYKYINSASSSAEFDQLHPYKYSVADGSLGTVGQYWSSTKAALTTAHLPVGKEGGLLVRFGYVQKAWWSWVEFNPAKLQEEDFTVVGTCPADVGRALRRLTRWRGVIAGRGLKHDRK